MNLSISLQETYGIFVYKALLFTELINYIVYAIWSIILLYRPVKSKDWRPYMKIVLETLAVLTILAGAFTFFKLFEYYPKDDIILSTNFITLVFLMVLSIILFIVTVESLLQKLLPLKIRL